MIGLVDCNNFYCSCERVFHPELNGRPVVVLSNNDGCIIARSNEAKALGIAMGTPLFQVREFLERNRVAVFSSNYNLYGDMSRRVMMLLADFTPALTQYSIDEAFLDLEGVCPSERLADYGQKIVRTIGRGTGIPVTMGVAPTKTLAKVASRYGKKYRGYRGVCIIDSEQKRIKALEQFPIEDVWGIGHRHAEKLRYHGIRTAWDFTQRSEEWVRRMMTVTGTRTWRELRGESCISVEDLPIRKSICTSRSFADRGLSDQDAVLEAVANFAAACARKLRAQNACCAGMTVFAYTSRFATSSPSNMIHRSLHFDVPTNDPRELVARAADALRGAWTRGDYLYKKAGVIVWDICSATAVQSALFDPIDRDRQQRLARAVDRINRQNGDNTVKSAIQGSSKRWHLKCEYLTHQYTTSLRDTLRVRIGG